MEKEYSTYSINLVGVGCEVDLLPINIKTLDPDLFDDLNKFIKKYNKHIENKDKYVFNGSDYIKTTWGNYKMKLKQPKTKEQARDQAIETQTIISNNNFSYYELMFISEHFEKTGKKFDLLDEFKENGIC